MDVWVYFKRKKEERRIKRAVVTGTSQFLIKKGRLRRLGHVERKADTD